MVAQTQPIRDPKQKVVEEAEEAEEGGDKNPHLSGTLTYLMIKETLLSGRHVEVIPIDKQELLHGALSAEKK